MKKEESKDQIICTSFFTERIIKVSGEVIMIVRGGNPQLPLTLFVGSPEEYCDFIHNM